MSPGARAILEAAGCRTVEELATFHPDGPRARGNLDATLVRRLRRGAQAHLLDKPLIDERPHAERLQPAAIVHLLADPFADRVLAIGVLSPAAEDGAFTCELPRSVNGEWAALQRLIEPLPAHTLLLHFGTALHRFYEQHAFEREANPALEARFVDLHKRLAAAAVYPRPVFALADFVQHGLGRDPLRCGQAGEAAFWATMPDGDARLRAKLHADLCDLAALAACVLEAPPTRVEPAAVADGAG
jgi:hypothetical protein